MYSFDLIPHPANPSDAITRISGHVRRRGDGLNLICRTYGAREQVRWPISLPRGFSDDLWRHTCFEAFVVADGVPGYVEINASPSRRWAIYRFDGYRSGMQRIADATGRVIAYQSDTTLLGFFKLPSLPAEAEWRIGVSAVIELLDGAKLYFALAHPPGNPDFHNPDCFIARLPAPTLP